MSELRAPDPTLTDARKSKVLLEGELDEVVTAHRMSDDGGCGRLSDIDWQEYGSEARWFAVPCRECFPEAPEPGHTPCPYHPRPGPAGCIGVSDPHLAWQVAS